MKPSCLLLYLLTGLLIPAILLGLFSSLQIELPQSFSLLLWGVLLAFLLVAALDALWLQRQPIPRIVRTLPGKLSVGRWNDIQLHIHHAYPQPITISLFDHIPESMVFEYQPQRIKLYPGKHSQLRYRVKPLLRGHYRFSQCEIQLPSPLHLWHAQRKLDVAGETRVYPDFARLYSAQLTAVDDWLSQLGVRQRPRRGLGREFHQLREFRDGDTLRQVDWKATARKRMPIAREYQDESDQQILFLLDCGRHMRSQDDELSHFDHALNACLLLSYVALRQGDAVGLSTCATEQFRYLPPRKGSQQLNVLLNGVYDLHSSQRPADFSAAVDMLLTHQKRRALIIIITNLRDEHDRGMEAAIRRLARKHQVLIASLREEVLERLSHTAVETLDQAFDYCGVMDYLSQRSRLYERLNIYNVPILDTSPGKLGPELISQYLAWKKGGIL